jgi:hypothetical protein
MGPAPARADKAIRRHPQFDRGMTPDRGVPDRMCEAVRRPSATSRSDDDAVNAALRRGGLDARGGYPVRRAAPRSRGVG